MIFNYAWVSVYTNEARKSFPHDAIHKQVISHSAFSGFPLLIFTDTSETFDLVKSWCGTGQFVCSFPHGIKTSPSLKLPFTADLLLSLGYQGVGLLAPDTILKRNCDVLLVNDDERDFGPLTTMAKNFDQHAINIINRSVGISVSKRYSDIDIIINKKHKEFLALWLSIGAKLGSGWEFEQLALNLSLWAKSYSENFIESSLLSKISQ